MDHLPTTHERAPDSLVVPFLCAEFQWEYSEEPLGFAGFKEFPTRYGLNFEALVAGGMPSRRVAAFLQSWLFFGILRETCSRPNYCFDPSDFLRLNEAGERIITTKALLRYLWYWQAARTQDDPDAMAELERTIDKCLGLAHDVLGRINQGIRQRRKSRDSAAFHWSDELLILFSISILGDYLTTARQNLRLYTPGQALEWEFPLLEQSMRDAGWCEGEISTLRKSCGISCRYYLLGIDRKILAKNHDRCGIEMGCRAYHMDYGTYRTSHHRDCTGLDACPELGPPVEDIVSAIQNGGSALADAEDVASDRRPRIIQAGGTGGGKIRYVAISHVWSDGLGNPWHNRLRLCQIRHIQNMVNSLYEPDQLPVRFWIDTFGIPVGKHNAEHRQTAIARIAQTFKGADKVLVLDKSLQMCKVDAIPWIEMLMRIQYSPWMTRLWTLLEGSLARNLYFQFADGAASSDYLNDSTVRKQSMAVSDILKELSDEKLRSCPSAIQLIRALATASPPEGAIKYATLPAQSDPTEESFRQDAIRLLRENEPEYALGETWRLYLDKLGLFYELDDDDESVKNDIDIGMSCPVLLHAFNSVASVRAIQAGLANLDDASSAQASSIFPMFEEACRGFRSRTTSRLDDETICLGAMLGADLTSVLQNPTMNWRWRELLDSVDCQRSANPVVRKLGVNTRRYTDACHLKRMAVVLSQVQQFPISIIFWNTPRLDSHPWAPRSLLDPDLLLRLPQLQGRASLNGQGLEFTISSHRLRRWHIDRPIPTTAKLLKKLNGVSPHALRHGKTAGHDVLTISPQGLVGGNYASQWLCVRFRSDDKTVSPSVSRKTWQDYIDNGEMDHLAVLFRGNHGLLVRVYEVKNGKHFARHIRLLEIAAREQNTTALAVPGTWLVDGQWCIS